MSTVSVPGTFFHSRENRCQESHPQLPFAIGRKYCWLQHFDASNADNRLPWRQLPCVHGTNPGLRSAHRAFSEARLQRHTATDGSIGVRFTAQPPNLLALIPPGAIGTGPLLGIDFGTFQFTQLMLPVPTPPFIDFVSVADTHPFVAPRDSVSASFVIDLVTVATTNPPAQVAASAC